jgi:transcriptional regulator with XRE-family HTH domain
VASSNKGVNIGSKIKKMRRARKMTFEELGAESGLTPDTIREIEKGDILPPVSSIIKIAKALQIDSGDLLSDEERENAEKRKVESYEKRTREYAYRPLTPNARNKHMKAFHVTIEPEQAHKMVEYQHEGEEFIYVLKGSLEISVGDNTWNLKEGQSIHFNSSLVHKLNNPKPKTTELLVVVYTP